MANTVRKLRRRKRKAPGQGPTEKPSDDASASTAGKVVIFSKTQVEIALRPARWGELLRHPKLVGSAVEMTLAAADVSQIPMLPTEVTVSTIGLRMLVVVDSSTPLPDVDRWGMKLRVALEELIKEELGGQDATEDAPQSN